MNYNFFNFYFLINNFFYDNKNSNFMLLNSLTVLNINNYSNIADEKNLLPNKSFFSNLDYSFLTNFFYLRNSSFIKFFMNNMIDVPICFKKSRSLKTKNFELPLLKFINFLMKKGKKEKTINTVFTSLRFFIKTLKISRFNYSSTNFS
jgi:hypothetical protein